MLSYDAFIPGNSQNPAEFGVYPDSVHFAQDGSAVFMVRGPKEDFLVAQGDSLLTGETFFDAAGSRCVKASLSHENACALRGLFPFTAPVPVLREMRTVGVGDRLGIATPGHIRVFEKYDALPVFAQQSIRELNLTGRTYENVLDCVTFSVFRENYQRGFGADGDHLKTPQEVEYALKCGYTMITLDCSEHIRNDVSNLTDAEVDAAYIKDAALEATYLNANFEIAGGVCLTFDRASFKRMTIIYGKAISFASEIYHTYIAGRTDVDFEISIDETSTPTTPLQHYFVANELKKRGVRFVTMAPRFCGEFQKGVDYIGDVAQFKLEFAEHAAIADQFGYKISVHSGSDKFSIFSIVGELTHGHFHVKTAGTNWLEAMRVVAMADPALYREIHKYALTVFAQATKYYHVTTDLTRIPDVDTLSDAELAELFKQNDARQLIHITYGLILNEKNADGSCRFRDKLYYLWRENAQLYADMLETHIGRHLQLLYSEIREI